MEFFGLHIPKQAFLWGAWVCAIGPAPLLGYAWYKLFARSEATPVHRPIALVAVSSSYVFLWLTPLTGNADFLLGGAFTARRFLSIGLNLSLVLGTLLTASLTRGPYRITLAASSALLAFLWAFIGFLNILL